MSEGESSGMLVLNPDVEMVSVREFPMDIRERLGGDATDFVLSDRTSRIGSQRVDSGTASFLRRFREPKRVVEAVFEHSLEMNRDPMELLKDVYPLLRTLRIGAVLLDPAVKRTNVLGPALSIGDSFEGYRILECVSDLAETDVYRAQAADGALVAIKYLRSGSDEVVRDNLRREIGILRHANERGCRSTPRLISADPNRADAYVCMEWFNSRTLFSLSGSRKCGMRERAGMVASMLDAYVDLHSAGILHGDVHSRNVLILADGSARLIDFGGARLAAGEHDHPRIGLVHFYEPEVARAVLAKEELPPPTEQGEQYCVAGLAYSAITGGGYLALSLETENALNQIAGLAPRPFEELGAAWPSVEDVLKRALSKWPTDRYPSFAAFRDSLIGALASEIPPQPVAAAKTVAPAIASNSRDVLQQAVWRLRERHGLKAALTRTGLSQGPTASLYAGSGGIAYGLLRLACSRQDSETLAAADVWISSALSQQNAPLAFTDGSVGAATETGPLALFHSVTGLHAVNALIRYASGDTTETRQALNAFIASLPLNDAGGTAPNPLTLFPLDATNGASSLLLGAALLLPLCGPRDEDIRARLETAAAHLCGIVQDQLSPMLRSENRFLGFAHGRTGAIYSLLRWADVSGAKPAPLVGQCLDELATLARHHGSGLAWPLEVTNPTGAPWTGWCHGSAGHLLTWTLAARVLQKSDYLEFALAAGRDIRDSMEQSSPSLCCGGAGEALSLFELARACGDSAWVDRGIELATQSVNRAEYTYDAQGLFRSEAGIALAAAEAMEPAASSWPICQSPL